MRNIRLFDARLGEPFIGEQPDHDRDQRQTVAVGSDIASVEAIQQRSVGVLTQACQQVIDQC